MRLARVLEATERRIDLAAVRMHLGELVVEARRVQLLELRERCVGLVGSVERMVHEREARSRHMRPGSACIVASAPCRSSRASRIRPR